MKEDRRVRKTKKLMQDALGKLLLQKPLKNITVREISELADINRGTFYLHYRDVYDMVEKIQNELFGRFNKIVDGYVPGENPDSLFPMLVEIYSLLAENAEISRCLIGKNGDAFFVDKLKNLLKEKCFANVQKLFEIEDEVKYNYFYNYIVSGCIGLISYWLGGEMKETPREIAEFTEEMIQNGAAAWTRGGNESY